MTKMEKLKKFELALAMSVIISGIRTAAVMVIGTATLEALVGAGKLRAEPEIIINMYKLLL